MSKHKGFTIVELLIVISVIGILASMMMVSSSESVSTARANNIISNLRNFSMAAMSFYVDSIDDLPTKDNLMPYVKKRMHNEGNIPDINSYCVINDTNHNGTWWAGYLFGSNEDRAKAKVFARTKAANLYWTKSKADIPTKNNLSGYDSTTTDVSGVSCVWMLIRSPKK